MKKENLIIFLALLIPYLLVFKALFLTGHLVWGDAPFFYTENLKELFNKPFIWDFRNDNFGAPQNLVLWLSLPTFMYGLLNYFFGLSNDLLIRLVFYFPATILTPVGAWVFVSQFTKNVAAKLLAAFLYTFNTYFLLVLDGGQLGVGLSYGLFPLSVYFLNRYFNNPKIKTFLLSLLSLFLISNVDLRTFWLTILFFLCWKLLSRIDKKEFSLDFMKNKFLSSVVKLGPLFLVLILLNAFWITPIVLYNNAISDNFSADSGLNLITLLNALSLFQPHFPLNEFGNLRSTPFYFAFIPALLLFGIAFIPKASLDRNYIRFLVLFLLFAYLAKGGNDPFGQIYSLIVNTIPFGLSFRDSSKFFMPLILSASILLALSMERISQIVRPKKFLLVVGLIYLYLGFLIYPAFLNQLTGALNVNQKYPDFEPIYQLINSNQGFSRTLWFPEKPALAFSSWSKPAISANTLFKESPFASMIQGEYDLFYFLHSPLLEDWLRTLGVKFVFFPEDQRKKVYSDQQLKDRQTFLNFVDSVFAGKVVSSITIPAYEIPNPKDHIFTQKKIIITATGTDLYESLKEKYNFDLSKAGAIFIQDRLLNPATLLNLPKDAGIILVKDQDLQSEVTMSFLQSHFLNLKNTKGKWGYYKGDEYLKWRYELLRRSIDTKDLGFRDPVLFSSVNGEEFNLPIDIKYKDSYYLAIRRIEASNSGLLKVKINNLQTTLPANLKSVFKWDLLGPFELEKRKYNLNFENLGGFKLINEIALITQDELTYAKSKANELINHFPVFDIDGQGVREVLNDLSGTTLNISYTQNNPTNYTVNITGQNGWVIFSDHYNPNWRLDNSAPFPIYGMINGFWVGQNTNREAKLYYKAQEEVEKGLVVSISSGVIIIVGVIIYILRKGRK